MTQETADAAPDVTCPACHGAGSIDLGAGEIECTLCQGQGEVEEAAADRFMFDHARWSNLQP